MQYNEAIKKEDKIKQLSGITLDSNYQLLKQEP
jgi:hypothetical protein